MVELTDLRKTYYLGGEEVHALDGVTLTVQDREFVAIIGASGSGKSTLMNMIGCLDSPDEGTCRIDGTDVTDMTEKELAIMRNRKIGFIFQQFNLLSKLTAYENVELPLIYQGLNARERRERTLTALDRVGLTPRMHHRPNQLSGGQQQRVAVARALATHPSLILADEPTGNLDSRSTEDIMRLLHELHDQGNTIILITHDNDIARQAQRQVRLMDGRIVSDTGSNEAKVRQFRRNDPRRNSRGAAAAEADRGKERDLQRKTRPADGGGPEQAPDRDDRENVRGADGAGPGQPAGSEAAGKNRRRKRTDRRPDGGGAAR